MIGTRHKRQAIRARLHAAWQEHRPIKACFEYHRAGPGNCGVASRVRRMQGTSLRVRLRKKVRARLRENSTDRLRLKKRRVDRILSNAGSGLMDETAKRFRAEPPVHHPLLAISRLQSRSRHST